MDYLRFGVNFGVGYRQNVQQRFADFTIVK
jgi:hypothetical protein